MVTMKKKVPPKKTLSAQVFDESITVPKEEGEKKMKSEKDVPPKQAKDLPTALPSEAALDIVTAKAVKTTVKFCGKWFHLVKGKTVTATASQIIYLRSCGLVE